MTTETRTTIECEDVTAIEFECVKCHARTIRRLDNWLRNPPNCNNCGEQWMVERSGDFQNLEHLASLIRGFADTANGRPFKLRLEIKTNGTDNNA